MALNASCSDAARREGAERRLETEGLEIYASAVVPAATGTTEIVFRA